MVPVYCCHNKKYLINVTIDDILSKFEVFSNHKLDKIYLPGSTRTELIKVLDKYCNEGDTL